MNEKTIEKIIKDIKDGSISEEEATNRLKKLSFLDMGYAKVDLHREIRTGFPEVVFGKGKTAQQIRQIAEKIYENHGRVLVTRLDKEKYSKIKELLPPHEYNSTGNIFYAGDFPDKCPVKVPLITGGTADLRVAEEAAVTLESMGCGVNKIYDAGVSGIHRILASVDKLKKAKVVIVIAGMDGVLPSVVGGCVCSPVIAVPTSTGYGASFSGLGPLLTMLNSCAPGVVVVNIDNGFGAGCAAAMINRQSL